VSVAGENDGETVSGAEPAFKPPHGVVPRHVAAIMDGNGRWAQARGLARIEGHDAGAKAAHAITEGCARVEGIERLTLYALSYDNLRKRPRSEISGLFKLLRKYIRKELPTVMDNNIRLAVIGETGELPKYLQREVNAAVKKSSVNSGMMLCVALNYSSRREIAHAAREVARLAAKGELRPRQITQEKLAEHLFTAGVPDVDLLIRTGGERRVSDFLLWQIAYAEIFVTDVFWPDFRAPHLHEALKWYATRQRRFGALEDI